ncbi:MAG: hypothetical protein WCL00_12390, partial [Bacteroidota bacterium]
MKQLRLTVLTFLGLTSFLKAADGKETLTEEQKSKIIEAYGQDNADAFISALEKEGNGETLDPSVALNLATNIAMAQSKAIAETAAITASFSDLEKKFNKMEASHTKIEATNVDLQNKLKILSAKAEDDIPGKVIVADSIKWQPSATGTDTFLSGEAQPFLAIDGKHPYNQRAYASLARKQGLMIPTFEAGSMDYSSLTSDLGDYYRIRKQDRIQGFLRELPSLAQIFPLESGFQDQASLVNLFITSDFSQA